MIPLREIGPTSRDKAEGKEREWEKVGERKREKVGDVWSKLAYFACLQGSRIVLRHVEVQNFEGEVRIWAETCPLRKMKREKNRVAVFGLSPPVALCAARIIRLSLTWAAAMSCHPVVLRLTVVRHIVEGSELVYERESSSKKAFVRQIIGMFSQLNDR